MSDVTDVRYGTVVNIPSGSISATATSGGTLNADLGRFGSGVTAVVYSGTQANLSGSQVNVRSGVSVGLGGFGSGFTSLALASGEIQLANKAVGISVSGVISVFCSSLYPMANTTYMAYVITNNSGFTAYVSSKTISGFNVGFNVTGIVGATIDWMVIR